jgi:hypothetical protein
MEEYTQESGLAINATVSESNSGLMDQDTRDITSRTVQLAMENFITRTVTHMKGSGSMIRLTGKELTLT